MLLVCLDLGQNIFVRESSDGHFTVDYRLYLRVV